MTATTTLRLAILASLAACNGADKSATGNPAGATTGPTSGPTTNVTGTGTGQPTGTGTGNVSTGTGTGTTSTGTGTGGTATGGTTKLCQNPQPVLDLQGQPSGLIQCADGTVNRIDDTPSPTNIQGNQCNLVGETCAVDADCNVGSHGKCMMYGFYGGPGSDWCSCSYACEDDAECNPGQACLHPQDRDFTQNDAHGVCRTAGCQTDADCASGECGLSAYQDGGCGTTVQFQCRDDSVDQCRSHSDCGVVGQNFCSWSSGNNRFQCEVIGNCTPGRPLRIETGEARVADTASRSDWLAALELPDCDGPLRQTLVDHWLNLAGMEHASVASFARFTLELMALGAPPDLLRDAQQAGIDEVEHARLAYAVASAFAGQQIGPGPLSLEGVTPATDVETVLDQLIDEACVGETVGTALVRESARVCTDPALRAILEQTAEDETRHAALAWRTLRWLLAANPELAPSVPGRFALAVARLGAELKGEGDEGIPEWGMLDAQTRERVLSSAVINVVEPCMAEILSAVRA